MYADVVTSRGWRFSALRYYWHGLLRRRKNAITSSINIKDGYLTHKKGTAQQHCGHILPKKGALWAQVKADPIHTWRHSYLLRFVQRRWRRWRRLTLVVDCSSHDSGARARCRMARFVVFDNNSPDRICIHSIIYSNGTYITKERNAEGSSLTLVERRFVRSNTTNWLARGMERPAGGGGGVPRLSVFLLLLLLRFSSRDQFLS